MKQHKTFLLGIVASLGFVVLILDTKTSLLGAKEGIELCLNSVLPTLFPFCVLTKILNPLLLCKPFPLLRPIGKIFGVPAGSESILLLGFISGYPIGAQNVQDAYRNKTIALQDCRRMLGFCSNAGPAFIFGMLGGLFETTTPLWCLLGIHIISSALVGCILPNKSKSIVHIEKAVSINLPKALEESVKTMACVCGWIIIFRVILQFFKHWFLWRISITGQAVFSGILELSQGCVSLYNISSSGLCYILCATVLGFGGICVAMQTASVVKQTGTGYYFPGKIMQTIISILLASLTQYILFNGDDIYIVPIWILICCITLLAFLIYIVRRKKKVVAIIK